MVKKLGILIRTKKIKHSRPNDRETRHRGNKALQLSTVGSHLTSYIQELKTKLEMNSTFIRKLNINIYMKTWYTILQLWMITVIERLALYIINNICMLNRYTNEMLKGENIGGKSRGKKSKIQQIAKQKGHIINILC